MVCWYENRNWVVVMTNGRDRTGDSGEGESQRSFLRYALHMAETAQSGAVQRVFRLYAVQQQALLEQLRNKRAGGANRN